MIWSHMVVARKQTLVQLSDALVAALDERAARDRRSRSDLIREAVEQYRLAIRLDPTIGENDRVVDGRREFVRRDPRGMVDRVAASTSDLWRASQRVRVLHTCVLRTAV